MRIILSRKGFDSSYGDCPSPILPDGTLLSLPIPSIKDTTKYTSLQYADKSLFEIIKELKPRTKIKEKYTCHLDPDIRNYGVEKNWQPLFGQEGASQTHLENNGISTGDVFLFFGWFRQTENKNGRLQYVKNAQDKHIIWGYFQVDDMYKSFDTLPTYLSHHPHATAERFETKNNCIYTGMKELSMDGNYPGAGTFSVHQSHILTKDDLSRSKWQLPDFFKEVSISHHSANSFKEEEYFDSAKIGQEFVVSEDERVTDWALSLIKKGMK